jgi:hypothetical protein
MAETNAARPTRLWIIGGLNVFSGLIGVGGLFVLAFAASVPEALRPGLSTWLAGGMTALFLIASSVLALLRFARAQYAMLAAAVIFFGWILEQNVELLLTINDLGGHAVQTRVFGTVGRCVIMLGLNLWATLSRPTRDFMTHTPTAPVL